MKSEGDPITSDEVFLRIVRIERFRCDEIPLISPGSFEPRGRKAREPDLTGISLYRLACQATVTDVLRHIPEAKRRECGVVGVTVGALAAIGLSARSEPTPPTAVCPDPVPGHVVIPELRLELFEQAEDKLLPTRLALANITSHDVRQWPEAYLGPDGTRPAAQ